MVFTQENIQFSESVVKYNLINFLNLLIDMGSLSCAGILFHNIGPLNMWAGFSAKVREKAQSQVKVRDFVNSFFLRDVHGELCILTLPAILSRKVIFSV